MKRCDRCGRENRDKAAYCAACGAVLRVEADQQDDATVRFGHTPADAPLSPAGTGPEAGRDRPAAFVNVPPTQLASQARAPGQGDPGGREGIRTPDETPDHEPWTGAAGGIGKRRVRRIGLLSAFGVGAGIYGLLTLVVGGLGVTLYVVLAAVGGAALSLEEFGDVGELALGVGGGLIGLLLVLGLGVISTAVAGGITLFLQALIYNLAARFVGGLEVDLV